MCPWVFRLIHLGRMVKDLFAGENLAPGFWVDIVVNGNDEPPLCQWFGDHVPQTVPALIPWHLRGGHEAIISFFANAQTEYRFNASQQA